MTPRPRPGSTTRNRPAPTVSTPRLGLEGYCPVAVTKDGTWVRGSSRHESEHDGVVYRFPNAAAKAAFDANPDRFLPAFNGDSLVTFAETGRRQPGQIRFSARSRATGRVFLFASAREKARFVADPGRFTRDRNASPRPSEKPE